MVERSEKLCYCCVAQLYYQIGRSPMPDSLKNSSHIDKHELIENSKSVVSELD